MAETDRNLKLNPISTNQLSSLIVGDAGLPKNIGQKGDPELEYLKNVWLLYIIKYLNLTVLNMYQL